MLTALEIVDQATEHMLKQGGRAQLDDTASCLYSCTFEDGEVWECPVGHFIKDEHYSPDIETLNTREAAVINALAKSGINTDDRLVMDVLADLQHIHYCLHHSMWKERLEELRAATATRMEGA